MNLSLLTPFASVALDLLGSRTEDAESSEPLSISSAYACDAGDKTYIIDNGAITLDNEVIVSDSVTSMLYNDGRIYYASQNLIKSYDTKSKSVKTEESCNGDISCFCLTDKGLYTYDGKSIVSSGSGTVLDMTQRKTVALGDGHYSSVDLSLCNHFSVYGDHSLILYFDNPDYDPEDAYENPEQHKVYRYYPESGKLCSFDPNAVDEDLILESFEVNAATSYEIGKNSFPLDEFPVGSFFTKNGKSCTCHNQGICVAAKESKGCNCMRYWPSEANCEIDLKSSQCWGFAEFCEYRAYGYIDKNSPSKFINAFGSKLNAKTWTANQVKETFTKYGAGGHLRVGGHSLFVISVSSTGFITYECNKSTKNNYCVIYTQSWTWDSFYTRKSSSDILWYYIPKELDDSPIIENTEYKPGQYQVKASALNLRQEPTTSSAIVDLIPKDALIYISEFNDAKTWGKAEYDGNVGWVSLEYVFYISSNIKGIGIETLPDKIRYYVDDAFSTEGLVVYATFIDGTTSEISGYKCTGYDMSREGEYTVRVTYEGFSTSFNIVVEVEEIFPESITLDISKLALLTGDSYDLIHTILPEDANMLGVEWKSSNPEVATVENGSISTYKAGKSVISVTTENGLTASCTLTVVDMPEGTAWSVDTEGMPLTGLPLGITPLDYSVRYRVANADGSYGSWSYIFGDELPASLADKDVQYQYRAITVSFISDGKDAFDPIPVDINTYIELDKYILERDGYLFAGWFKDGQSAQSLDISNAYKNKVLIEKDTEFYAGWISLGLVNADKDDPLVSTPKTESFAFAGAELSIKNEAAGIRFYTRISASLISDIKKLSSSCEYGTVVILKSALKSDLEISGSKIYLNSKKPVKVAASNVYASYDEYIVYNALVTGFTDDYIDENFAVRPYIKYKDANGNSHTYYYTCVGSNVSYKAYYTSLYDVAKIAYKDADALTKLWISENILEKVK